MGSSVDLPAQGHQEAAGLESVPGRVVGLQGLGLFPLLAWWEAGSPGAVPDAAHTKDAASAWKKRQHLPLSPSLILLIGP